MPNQPNKNNQKLDDSSFDVSVKADKSTNAIDADAQAKNTTIKTPGTTQAAQAGQNAGSTQAEEQPVDSTQNPSANEPPAAEGGNTADEEAPEDSEELEEDGEEEEPEEEEEEPEEEPDEESEGDEENAEEDGSEDGEEGEEGGEGEGVEGGAEEAGAEGAEGAGGEESAGKAAKGAKGAKNAEQAEEAAKAAKTAKAAKDAQAAANTAKVVAAGGSCWWIGLIVVGIIFIIAVVFSFIMMCKANRGDFGKAIPIHAGKDSEQVKNILNAAKSEAKTVEDETVKGFNKLALNDEDKKFIESGEIDTRLAEALKYLSDRHGYLNISRVSSGSEDVTYTDENGQQVTTTQFSAHKEGLAADVSQIDYVYKVREDNQICKPAFAALCGPFAQVCKKIAEMIKLGDLVFYSDEDKTEETAAAENMDISTIEEKIDIQQAVIDREKEYIEQNKQKIEDLKASLENAKASLEVKYNDGNLTAEQRAKIQTQIDKMNGIINQITTYSNNINELNQTITNLTQTITDLEQKLIDLKKNLQKIQDMADQLGLGDITSVTNDINKTINQIIVKMDAVSGQIRGLSQSLSQITEQVASQTENLTQLVENMSGDIDGSLDQIDQATGTFTLDANLDSIKNVSDLKASLPSLEEFKNVIQELIAETAEALAKEALEALKDKLETAVKDELNDALGEMGLGFLFDDSLLRLPCMGFVPPSPLNLAGGDASLGDSGMIDSSKVNDALGQDVQVGPFKVNMLEYVKKIIPEQMLVYMVVANTKYKDNEDTQAIPIKVKWQDSQPDNPNVSGTDDKDMEFMNPLIYYKVYQPEARRKVKQVVKELLDFPYYKKNLYYYRVNQLIVYSHDRDVQPFWDILKKIYELPRATNKGLFAMPEAWAQIHIGY